MGRAGLCTLYATEYSGTMRRIPATMATQHPDNAHGPFWDTKDGFVAVYEEPGECVTCLRDLDVDEFMWDWEGKYADEAVMEKLYSSHFDYFKKQPLGNRKFLTFRLPNVWQEKGYSLLRALMVMITSEDLSRDVGFKSRPLFEAILPMTERAEQLMYIQRSFRELARFKSRVFNRSGKNTDYLEVIPLVEGVEHQVHIRKLLSDYVRLHKKEFRSTPAYIRPFLARSDPALICGFIPNVLANKVALSEMYSFGKEHGIKMFPIIGAGSLVFRGGLSPSRIKGFVEQYGGVRTMTIQSAFRYDFPRAQVKKALAYLSKHAPTSRVQFVDKRDHAILLRIIKRFSDAYQSALSALLPDLEPVFAVVPKRRERRQHIGFLAYKRQMGKKSLPRAINFTAACYSLGIPPEFIGLGRALAALTPEEMRVLQRYYRHLRADVSEAGRYVNIDNVRTFAKKNRAWEGIVRDIELAADVLSLRFGPRTKRERLHRNLTYELLLRLGDTTEMNRLVTETGKLRRSLG